MFQNTRIYTVEKERGNEPQRHSYEAIEHPFLFPFPPRTDPRIPDGNMKRGRLATKCQGPVAVCSWWRLIVPLYDENLSGASNLLVFHCARTFSWAEPGVEPDPRRSRERSFVAEQCGYLDGSIIASFTPLRCVVTGQTTAGETILGALKAGKRSEGCHRLSVTKEAVCSRLPPLTFYYWNVQTRRLDDRCHLSLTFGRCASLLSEIGFGLAYSQDFFYQLTTYLQ